MRLKKELNCSCKFDQFCSLIQYNNHLYSSSNKCLKVWDIETLELINEIQMHSRNGWLRILMEKDKCIYAGCRHVIKVNFRFESLFLFYDFTFNSDYILGIRFYDT